MGWEGGGERQEVCQIVGEGGLALRQTSIEVSCGVICWT